MIDKLEFLIAVARERNFRRAAETCGVAQPTLSAGIKQLEESLGVLLVQRSSRFHGLTPEGEQVLGWAKRLVGDAKAMRQELQQLRQGLSGHLRLAVVPTALGILPGLINPFRARHPGVRFTVLSRTSAQVLDMLDNLEADAGVTYLENEPLHRVRTFPLYVESYRLLTWEGAPLADRDRITWAQAGAIPLCLLTPDMQNRRIVGRLLHQAGAAVAPMLESNSIVTLLAHVRTGCWATIVPESLATVMGDAPGVRSIPLVEPWATYQVGVVVPHRTPMAALVEALVDEVARVAPTLSAGQGGQPTARRPATPPVV